MERIVIAAYKPIPGREEELEMLIRSHWQLLNEQNLVSDRKPIIVKAKDGTIIEVFGWKSKEAIDMAHKNPVVLKMWEDYARCCEYIPAGKIPELMELFSDFKPLN